MIVFAALALACGLAAFGGSTAPGAWFFGFAVCLFTLVLLLIRLIGSHAAASMLRSNRRSDKSRRASANDEHGQRDE